MQPILQHSDFARQGVVYGYRAVGDYGSAAVGLGNIYYFGRSKQASVFAVRGNDEETQKETLRKKCKRDGLNAPRRVMLWVRVQDVDQVWEDVRMKLRGQPLITNHATLGDNWYTVENMGPEDFGTWCDGVVRQLQLQL